MHSHNILLFSGKIFFYKSLTAKSHFSSSQGGFNSTCGVFSFPFQSISLPFSGFIELSGTRLGLSDNSIQNTREEIIPNKKLSANDLKCGVEEGQGGSWLENLPNFVANFP